MQNSIPEIGLSGVRIRTCYVVFFPCGLFWNNVCCRLSASNSALAAVEDWPANAKSQKLCNRVPEHEKSSGHRKCYLVWRKLERHPSL